MREHPVPDPDTTLRPDGSPAPARSDRAEGLERYEQVHEINRGGMGAILSAVDPRVGREVAIKVLPGGASPTLARRFQAEAEVTGQLEHPNIVPLHEVGRTADGAPYFSMKLVRGVSLAEALEQCRRDAAGWPLHRLLAIFGKVCDAMAFAHSRGVVHRDIKPANIMIGEFGEVLVMDWGLATGMRSALRRSSGQAECGMTSRGALVDDPLRTLDGTVMGTPAYMPPEQATGAIEQIDQRSDIYALGAVLYQILTLSPPFEGVSSEAVLQQVREGRLQRPAERAPGRHVPRELEAVVLQAMDALPARRYQTVGALQADIEAYLAGRTLAAARYRWWQRVLKWTLRHRAPVAGVASVALALAGLLAFQSWRAAQDRRARIAAHLARAGEAVARIPAPVARRLAPLEVAAAEGRLRFESGPPPPLEPGQRDDALAAAWQAASAIDQALLLDPLDDRMRALRRQAGRRLGLVALLARDYTLARRAFADLEAHGLSAAARDRLVAGVEAAETALLRHRRERLERMIAAVRQGLGQTGEEQALRLDDLIYQAVGYREAQTVRILDRLLRELAAGPRRWTQTERQLARLATTVLARLGRADAVEPLARWLALLADPQLAAEAGEALCLTGRPAAYAPLIAARDRLGIHSYAWGRIVRLLDRVPGPDARGPRTAGAYFYRGLARLQQGRLDAAIADFSQALVLDPRMTGAYHNRGAALRRQGRLEAAIADFDRVIELDPRSALSYSNRGLVRAKLGRLAAAIADYDKAIELDPRIADVYSNRGLARHQQGKLEAAGADFDRAIELDPRSAEAFNNRGGLRKDQGRFEAAIADFDQAIALDPRLAAAYNNRGFARGSQGLLEAAIADHSKAIELDPRYAGAYNNRGLARVKQGRLEAAIADFDKAIELDPRHVKAYGNRGLARELKGRMGLAMADYDKAIALDPRYALAYLNRGLALQKQGRLAAAIADLTRAIERDPRNARAHNARGAAQAAYGRIEAAIADFSRAIELDPQDAAAWSNRGLARNKQGRLEAAIADFTRAIELEPNRAATHIDRGNAREQRKQHAAALADYDRAIELEPRNWKAWAGRGLALAHTGRAAEGKSSLQHAIELAPAAVRPWLRSWFKRLGD